MLSSDRALLSPHRNLGSVPRIPAHRPSGLLRKRMSPSPVERGAYSSAPPVASADERNQSRARRAQPRIRRACAARWPIPTRNQRAYQAGITNSARQCRVRRLTPVRPTVVCHLPIPKLESESDTEDRRTRGLDLRARLASSRWNPRALARRGTENATQRDRTRTALSNEPVVLPIVSPSVLSRPSWGSVIHYLVIPGALADSLSFSPY